MSKAKSNKGPSARARANAVKVGEISGKPLATIGYGTRLGEALEELHGKAAQPVLSLIKDIAKLDTESQKQAAKELRIHQYKAQAKANGKVWKEEMASDTSLFMAKGAGTIRKQQRSIAANYSRTLRILKALIDKKNVDKIVACTSLNTMAAASDFSGTRKASAGNAKPMSEKRFELYDGMAERLIAGETLEMLEKHILHCLKLAESKSVLLSEDFKAVVGIKDKRKLRRVA